MTCECGPSNDDAFEEEAAGLNRWRVRSPEAVFRYYRFRVVLE
ncbi:MAG: hypothetical protein ACI9DF_005691 [Verrucomicrobiales bacterium]|jgi:hypothetical protein